MSSTVLSHSSYLAFGRKIVAPRRNMQFHLYMFYCTTDNQFSKSNCISGACPEDLWGVLTKIV